MLLPIKTICNPKFARRDGTTNIFIQYCYSSTHRTLLNTEIAIPASFWNKRKDCISEQLPSQFGSPVDLNQKLTDQLRQVEDLVTFAKNNEIENIGAYVKATFKPDGILASSLPMTANLVQLPTKKKQPDLFKELDDYIVSKEKKVCEKALATFKSMKDHLFAFQQYRKAPITFNSFDYSFYEDFIEFLAFEYKKPRLKEDIHGLKTNTIGKTIKQFRIFIADRVKRKIIQPIDLSDYKIPEEETDAIYLSSAEIEQIYRTDLSSQPHLVPYRNCFVLACLSGLRFSDFSTLKSEDLKDGMLFKKQNKTNGWVVIPLRPIAREIFNTQFTDTLRSLTNQEFNRHIKNIGELSGISAPITFSHRKGNKDIIITKPKYEWITTHTARRSFCTNEFLAGTPVKLIMAISGHKSEKDFYRYIRVSPLEAAQKIAAIWHEREYPGAIAG